METNFESILLKKLTHSSQFFGKAMPILRKKYFTDLGNQELFRLIKDYYGQYREIPSLVELVTKVKDVSNAEIRKEIIKSLEIISKTDEAKNVDFLLDETLSWVKDALYLEALRIGSDGLMKKDDDMKLKAQKLMDERARVSIDSDLGLDFDDIDTMIHYYSERMIGIRTQHKQMNKRLGPGFLPGTLSVILAASGIGKSLMMTDLISGMIKEGKNILLLSLEMSDKEIMKRVHANAMDLPINSLIHLSKTEGELKELEQQGEQIICKQDILDAYNRMKTSGTCGKFFVKDYPTGSLSALMIEQIVEQYRIEQGIEFDIIFVDYLGIMKSDLVSQSAGLYSYVKSIGEEVRGSAKKMDLPIVSASQLNRGATNTTEGDNTNVSDSLGTVMIADWMLFLLQNEELKAKKEIVCKVTKNRFNGRTDTWPMGVDYEHMRFNDMVIQDTNTVIPQISTAGDISSQVPQISNKVTDDFGIVTPEKQAYAEKFGNAEVKQIVDNDANLLREHAKREGHEDPFKNGLDDLYKQLGIETDGNNENG